MLVVNTHVKDKADLIGTEHDSIVDHLLEPLCDELLGDRCRQEVKDLVHVALQSAKCLGFRAHGKRKETIIRKRILGNI